jgi:1,4-alpha-glucan branching enzyme
MSIIPDAGNPDCKSYEYYGAHILDEECIFRIWAPDALKVYVYGEFNNWVKNDPDFLMQPNGVSGEFELRKKGIGFFTSYRYNLVSEFGSFDKTDPYSFYISVDNNFSSKIYDHNTFKWSDDAWIQSRKKRNIRKSPLNIYECHLGSWKRNSDGSFMSYMQIAEELTKYVKENGYTHIELLPIMEHPFYGSWGYEITNYYAPTSRYGSPDGLKYLVNYCHTHGIGVIFDWQPAHFPKDSHGLYKFNGNWCYEYEDESKREQPLWKTCTFDFGKPEVQKFLISNAVYWIDKFHIDGIRVDSVASMIYLDFERNPGDWSENEFGGRENLEALNFLKKLNKIISDNYPDVFTVAEESNGLQMVTSPTDAGGLGFTFKWNMGWTHDTIEYARTDPFFRKNKHQNIVFPESYSFSEKYILPFSHDDVVNGKMSLFEKMFGSEKDKFAGSRLFFGYMIAHPGKKLSFMGNEFGQRSEWNPESALDWSLIDNKDHSKLLYYIRKLNYFYLEHPSLWQDDDTNKSFRWISNNDVNQNIIIFMRICKTENLIFVFNFAPVTRYDYRIGVPENCLYTEIFSSDEIQYGGSGIQNGMLDVYPFYQHGFPQQISLTVPPLSMICLKSKK